MSVSCPTQEELSRWLADGLSESKIATLEPHINNCPACQARAAAVLEDALKALAAREAPAPESVSAPAVTKELNGDSGPDREALTPGSMNPDSPFIRSCSESENYPFLSPAQEDDELGRLGGYRVLAVLGQGGMGIVFRAEDVQLRRQVAMKVMRPALASESNRQRFLREARVAATLAHDHIVPIFQVGEDRGIPFIVMPLLQGESLAERLSRDKPLPLAEVCRIGREVALGLAAAHEVGLVHRDVKPANIWLEQLPGLPAGSYRVKLLDFGLARDTAEHSDLSQPGLILGTPHYMAPEQAEGRPNLVSPALDMWALGVILYRCLAGQLPFVGANMLETLERIKTCAPEPLVGEGLSAELNAICLSCLDKDPARRPSAADLAPRLEHILLAELEPSVPFGPTVVQGEQRWPDSPSPGRHLSMSLSTALRRSGVRRTWLLVGLVSVAVILTLLLRGWPRPTVLPEPSPSPEPIRAHFQVLRFPGAVVGRSSDNLHACRFGDGVRIEVELSRPAHAYLLAVDCDGTQKLLWPANEKDEGDAHRPPPLAQGVRFPTDRESAYTLDDHPAGGIQVFAIVVSQKPLPSYQEWSRGRELSPWQRRLAEVAAWSWSSPRQTGADCALALGMARSPLTVEGVWAADREATYPLEGLALKRGQVKKMQGLVPLAELCRWLAQDRSVDAVEAIAFSVAAREDEP